MIALARPPRAPLDAPHKAAAQARSAAESSPPPHSQPGAAPRADWQTGFLALLPDVYFQLRWAFRRLAGERREDAVEEALANAMLAYRRLAELGKTDVAYATPLANYAVKQVVSGRQVASPLNKYDALSVYAQRQLGFRVGRLSQPDTTEGTWKELLVADRRATPAELAASRLDVAAWWRRLPRRKRRIAAALAAGATTSEAARTFKVTAGRISQLRRELESSWQEFHGDGGAVNAAAARK